MEALLRWREPIAFALVAVVLARPVVLAVAMSTGALAVDDPRTAALAHDPAAVLALAAAGVWCARPPSARARLINAVAAGAVVVSLGLAGVVAGHVLPALSWPEVAMHLIVGVGELVALVLLLVTAVVSRGAVPALEHAGADAAGREHGGVGDADEGSHKAPSGIAPKQEAPLWEPDQATGAVWFSADAAASGEAGMTGSAQEDGGWAPLARPGRELPPPPDTPNRPA